MSRVRSASLSQHHGRTCIGAHGCCQADSGESDHDHGYVRKCYKLPAMLPQFLHLAQASAILCCHAEVWGAIREARMSSAKRSHANGSKVNFAMFRPENVIVSPNRMVAFADVPVMGMNLCWGDAGFEKLPFKLLRVVMPSAA